MLQIKLFGFAGKRLGRRPVANQKRQFLRSRIAFQSLESRMLLAGDVTAGIGNDGLLSVDGDDQSNGVLVRQIKRSAADSAVVRDGATTVSLDVPLLADAASLTITSVNGDPVDLPQETEEATVDFPITPLSDFRLTDSGDIFGVIDHTGTVGFNENGEGGIVVGSFTIGFDAARVSETTSGFYVADNEAGLGVLFDIGSPVIEIVDSSLTVSTEELLVSAEFAGILFDLGLAEDDLTGADVGDAEVDATTAILQTRRVDDGATSVVLDTATLELFGIFLRGAEPTADSSLENGVGFQIEESTSFSTLISEAGDDLVPLGGTIDHSGSVTLELFPQTGDENGSAAEVAEEPGIEVTVGDFSIGFDPARISESTSGFFVADTIGGLGVLFDVAPPSSLSYDDPELSIGPADLLVSSEFAGTLSGLLGIPDLTGADVGDTQIGAEVTSRIPFVQVLGTWSSGRTSVNGGRSASFPAIEVDSLSIDTGDGRDSVRVDRIDLAGDLMVDLGDGRFNSVALTGVDIGGETTIGSGAGRDRVSILHSTLSSLDVSTGSGSDRVTLIGAHLAGDASIDLDSGNDTLTLLASDIEGQASFDGGRGRDRLFSLFSKIGPPEPEIVRFERRFGA